jgi:hypothetical protein
MIGRRTDAALIGSHDGSERSSSFRLLGGIKPCLHEGPSIHQLIGEVLTPIAHVVGIGIEAGY